MSVEASTTFTVMHSDTMPEIFGGQKGPERGGCYLYGRHFNPTVYTLGKQLAALVPAANDKIFVYDFARRTMIRLTNT